MSQSHARIRKLPVYDHITHMVKIDILTGYEKTGNLHFILKINFHSIIIKKTMHFLETYTVNYKTTAYCLMKFC